MASFTRNAIIRSFIKLLDERPLSKISVRDIVEDCGVNRNTFYYHFADIPSLVEALTREEIDRIIAQNARIASLSEVLDVATSLICEHRQAVLHLYNSSHRDIFERHLMETANYTAQKYMDTAFPDADILESDREIIVRIYACECYGLIVDWLNHSLSEDRREAFRRMCELRAGTAEMMLRRCVEDKAVLSSPPARRP